MAECEDVSPHGRKDFDVRVSAMSVVMSGVWVISQKVDVSPHGSKDLVPGYPTYQLLQLESP